MKRTTIFAITWALVAVASGSIANFWLIDMSSYPPVPPAKWRIETNGKGEYRWVRPSGTASLFRTSSYEAANKRAWEQFEWERKNYGTKSREAEIWFSFPSTYGNPPKQPTP